jgi:hypothetical protein
MTRRLSLRLRLVLAFVVAPTVALAQIPGQPQTQATQAWRSADQCAKDAFKKYPDYTEAAKSQREAMRRECLRNHDLPEPAPGNGS